MSHVLLTLNFYQTIILIPASFDHIQSLEVIKSKSEFQTQTWQFEFESLLTQHTLNI